MTNFESLQRSNLTRGSGIESVIIDRLSPNICHILCSLDRNLLEIFAQK